MSEKSEEACGPAGDSTRAVMACVKSLEEDLASAQDKFLRLAADFDNFKKRSAQEADRRATAQKSGFMHELLPVIDNLERALTVDPSASPDQLRTGVHMTLQQLHQLLRRHGVETEDTVGQTFDPHRHEALRVRRDASMPDDAVLEVYQPGYYYREGEVLRPAAVVVNDLSQPEPARHDGNGG
jgi:molecular chaperone GrpE